MVWLKCLSLVVIFSTPCWCWSSFVIGKSSPAITPTTPGNKGAKLIPPAPASSSSSYQVDSGFKSSFAKNNDQPKSPASSDHLPIYLPAKPAATVRGASNVPVYRDAGPVKSPAAPITIGGGSGYNTAGGGGQHYVQAAVVTRHKVHYVDVPSTTNAKEPTTIEVGARPLPISLLFRSRSTNLNVEQVHHGGEGSYQETSSQDEPHTLKHVVTKPVIQELREIIKPFRFIHQDVKPVQEYVETLVAGRPGAYQAENPQTLPQAAGPILVGPAPLQPAPHQILTPTPASPVTTTSTIQPIIENFPAPEIQQQIQTIPNQIQIHHGDSFQLPYPTKEAPVTPPPAPATQLQYQPEIQLIQIEEPGPIQHLKQVQLLPPQTVDQTTGPEPMVYLQRQPQYQVLELEDFDSGNALQQYQQNGQQLQPLIFTLGPEPIGAYSGHQVFSHHQQQILPGGGEGEMLAEMRSEYMSAIRNSLLTGLYGVPALASSQSF